MVKMVWAIYARKSKTTDKGESIDNQIEAAKNCIRANYPGVEIEFVIYIDDGYSGKSMRRPQFAQLMEDAKTEKFSGVVTYRFDRMSRNVADFSSIVQRLTKWGVAFVSVNEKFDTSTPMGEAMMYIAAVFAQLERQTIAERVRDNMLMLSETGRWLGGKTPYGFISQRVAADKNLGTKAKSHLVATEALSEIEMLVSLYEQLGSFHAVIKHCSENDIVINGSSQITDAFLKGVLTNPTYCIADQDAYEYYSDLGVRLPEDPALFSGQYGIMPYNRHQSKTGGGTFLNDTDQWVLAVGEHPGVITGARWVRLQKRIARNKERYDNFSSSTNEYALLSGIVFCHHCGGRMYTKKQNQAGRKGSAQSFFYLCDNHRKYGDNVCPCGSVLGHRLDEAVIQYLESCAADRSELLDSMQNAKLSKNSRKRIDGDLVLLEKKKKELELKQSGAFAFLGDMMSRGETEIPQSIRDTLDQITQQLEQVKKEIEEKVAQSDSIGAQEKAIQEYEKFLSKELPAFKSLPVPAQRDLLQQVFSRVEWDAKQEKLLVFTFGAPNAQSAAQVI